MNRRQLEHVIEEVGRRTGQGLETKTPEFAPSDWMMRARPIIAGGYTGLCMEIHDLAISKFGAGRPKDFEFNRALVKLGVIDQEELLSRLGQVQGPEAIKGRISARIKAAFRP